MGINGEKFLFLAPDLFAKCSELMRQLMGINGEKFLFLEHELFAKCVLP